MIPQKFSMGYKSGDAGGQFVNRDPKMPILARYDLEFLAACHGDAENWQFFSFRCRPWYHGSIFCQKKSW